MDDLISRQAAIDALEREKSLVERPITETRWFDFGLRKAQDVLSELPSAQPEAQLSQEDATLDCISRIAVYDRVDRIVNVNHLDPELVWFTPIGVKALIAELPSAQPEIKCIAKIMLTEEQVQEAFEKAKKEILAAQPERKKGKWAVSVIRGNWNDEEIRTCPECGKTFRNLDIANYCPNCGLPMETEVGE